MVIQRSLSVSFRLEADVRNVAVFSPQKIFIRIYRGKRTFVMSANLVSSVVKKATNQALLSWTRPKVTSRLMS